MIQFTRRKQCSVKGSCSAITKLYRSTLRTTIADLISRFQGSLHTRNQRGRASSDRMRSNIASALSTIERSGEGQPTGDGKQRGASTVTHMVMSETLQPSRRVLRHQTCRATHRSVPNTKNTSIAWPHRSPHQAPSIAFHIGWAVSLATSTKQYRYRIKGPH